MAAASNSAVAGVAYRNLQQEAIDNLPYFWTVEGTNVRGVASRCLVNNHQNTGLFVESASCRT